MPYSVGEKGSYGCSGYPVVKDGTSEVMGCHDTAEAAQRQIAAINMSEAEKGKKKMTSGLGQPEPASNAQSHFNWSTPVRKPERSSFKLGKSEYGDSSESSSAATIKEGDYVMGETMEGTVHGRVEHIMWEGGVLGSPEGEYSLQSMPPSNPAMSVRIFDEIPGGWEETAYSIGMMYKDAKKIDINNHDMSSDKAHGDDMYKAETYTPTSGMKSAARRALKWKEEGKAKGAGTAVGWGRARDIVAGRSMSLSVVKRMYSFFSRHEKGSKPAKGFRAGEEGYPSKGRVMWDAWGGDAGYSWSRKIAERESNKMFDDVFGKDAAKRAISEKSAKAQSMMEQRAAKQEVDLKGYKDKGYKEEKADSVRVGQMVSWNSSGGTARGKVKRIIRNGSYKVPGTDVTVTGTPDDPAAVITLYRDGEATDTIVAHKVKTLRAS